MPPKHTWKPSPFLTLYIPNPHDALRTTKALERIRDRIYFFIWVTIRSDPNRGDFIIEYLDFRRNVAQRHCPRIFRGMQLNQRYCDISLLRINKVVSEDFSRYIYGVSTVEINVEAFVYSHNYDFTNAKIDVKGRQQQFQHQLGTNKRLVGLYAKHFMLVVAFKKLAKKLRSRAYLLSDSAECICNTLNTWFEHDKMESVEIIVNSSTQQINREEVWKAARPLCSLRFIDWRLSARGVQDWLKRPTPNERDANEIKACSKTWAKMLEEKHERMLCKTQVHCDLIEWDDASDDGSLVLTPATTALSVADSDLIDLESIL